MLKSICNTYRRLLVWLLCLAFAMGTWAAEENVKSGENPVDVQKIVFSHIGDSYEWHITRWGEVELAIPLPIIVRSAERGWYCFLFSALEDNGGIYEGFYIASSGDYKDKIVERNVAGEEVRPLDLSMTKIAFSILINSILLLVIILSVSASYRKRKPGDPAPKGFVGMMEMLIMMVNDDLIKGSIGENYRRFSPYLLTIFFFIFLNNLMGLIPIFPGGASVTGNIAVTLVLAVCTMLMVNLFGTREYWKEIFWPEVPLWLKVPIPLMPLVEIVGIFTKPFSLTIRLFANMMAGHAVALSLTCIVFITASLGAALNGTMTVLSVLFSVFMSCLELLVAFIQAYVFTMLSAVFIGLSQVQKEEINKV